MRSRYWLLMLALCPVTVLAWDCEFKADRAGGVEAEGVEKVIIRSGAGDMKVVGRGTAVRIEARGVVCASTQELLDASQITVRREGNTVYVETALPENRDGSFFKNQYARLDIGIALPSSIPVEAEDSSGDATFEDLAALTVQDSSGDLDVDRIAGLVDATDSSGDLKIEHAGSVRVRDSSGDIEVDEVRADVEVVTDSSGDIRIARVDGNVRVQEDSSGGIRIEDVKGSVNVDADSSGDIYAGRVRGNFTVGDDSSGSIGHESIGGKITLPADKRDDAE
jgi:DUF4097 and DUF4098 domain-containing protein YvlB